MNYNPDVKSLFSPWIPAFTGMTLTGHSYA